MGIVKTSVKPQAEWFKLRRKNKINCMSICCFILKTKVGVFLLSVMSKHCFQKSCKLTYLKLFL